MVVLKLRLRLFIFILIIIGVLASFYAPGVLFTIGASIYGESPSPYNINWSGTSILLGSLRSRGIDVVIVNSTSELMDELGNGGLLLVIAPDRLGLDNDTIDKISNGVVNGSIGLAVFDENTTSNPLLSRLGLIIDGRSILDPSLPETPQYPRAIVIDREGRPVSARLNWASTITISRSMNPRLNLTVFAASSGVLDINDNGRIDGAELLLGIQNLVVGVLGSAGNHTSLLVFSDSFPLLNIAFTRNYTLTPVFLDYVSSMARDFGGRVIIPNFMYKIKTVNIKLPFHVSLLFLMLTYFLHRLDQLIDTLVLSNLFLKMLATLLAVIGIALIYRYIFKITGYADYEPTPVDEVVFIAETPVTESMIKGKRRAKGVEKTYIINYWSILSYAYSKILGVRLEDLVGNRAELEKTASIVGINPDDLEKTLTYLYNIYLKASGKGGLLPIVFSWPRTLRRYVEQTDKLLNLIGYTLTRKGGLKDVLYLIK